MRKCKPATSKKCTCFSVLPSKQGCRVLCGGGGAGRESVLRGQASGASQVELAVPDLSGLPPPRLQALPPRGRVRDPVGPGGRSRAHGAPAGCLWGHVLRRVGADGLQGGGSVGDGGVQTQPRGESPCLCVCGVRGEFERVQGRDPRGVGITAGARRNVFGRCAPTRSNCQLGGRSSRGRRSSRERPTRERQRQRERGQRRKSRRHRRGFGACETPRHYFGAGVRGGGAAG
mmetsp:Transcript_30413/g.51345  ORF Transcript_30413/g.51345 Transcript_30413/m.51345 type:complete len:231 (-) Transcript_30413:565-1257(-)